MTMAQGGGWWVSGCGRVSQAMLSVALRGPAGLHSQTNGCGPSMWAEDKAVGLDEITPVVNVAKKRRFPRPEPGAPNTERSQTSGCSTGAIREEGGRSSDCGRQAMRETWVTHRHRCC